MNRKLILSAALSGLMLAATAQTTVAPAIPRDGKIEKKVEALLKKMTLEEKIGQMTELTIDVITKRDNSTQEFQIDDALLDTVIGKYKVGSILNVPQGVAQSKEKWEEIIRKIQDKSMKVMGIPCIYGVDQIHGTTYTLGGTFFPQGINMAATFNRELVREGARISAYETKAGSIPWTYAPVLDLARDARWPRHWENYGEDCYVNAEMGREAVFGFQGSDPNHIGKQQVAACIKHYMGYGVPVSGKDRTPSSITVQDMREKHFAPFLEGIKAGALSVMVNSAMNNGLPFHANYELLTEWLKEDLNWDGMIVTDWADINNLYTRDKIAGSKKEAIKIFEEKKVRTVWNDETEEWFFSIVDVVSILTESVDGRKYWNKLKQRLKAEGSELVTNCHQLKLPSTDGKYYKTDVATTEQLFRLIQSIPSPKAEPFKLWMAQVAKERLDEMQDPELTIDRAMREYKALGYSDNWINQRLKSIEIRKDLTDEWKRHGLQEGIQFATLTDIIYQTWAGKTSKEYKQFKGLKKESLRDNMTNTELALNMLAEAATTELSKEKNPQHLEEHEVIAKQGGKAAEAARKQLESDLGHSVISPLNARTGLRLKDKNDKE